MTKTKVRRIEKVRAKINGIVIVQPIDIKTLLRMGRDCEMMVICRRLSETSRETFGKKSFKKEYTLCY